MPCCVAIGCSVREADKTANPPITFHQFPSDEELRRKWVQAVRRENWQPAKRSRLCSKHFREDDFDRSPFYSKLKRGVIPSIFKGFPKHLQKQIQGRKVKRKRENEETLPQVLSDSNERRNNVFKAEPADQSIEESESHPVPEIPSVAAKPEPVDEELWEDHSCMETWAKEEHGLSKPTPEEFENTGTNVARKLARMSSRQAIYAESIIANVLRLGLLQKLQEHTDICNNGCGRQTDFKSQSLQVSTSEQSGVKREPDIDL